VSSFSSMLCFKDKVLSPRIYNTEEAEDTEDTEGVFFFVYVTFKNKVLNPRRIYNTEEAEDTENTEGCLR